LDTTGIYFLPVPSTHLGVRAPQLATKFRFFLARGKMKLLLELQTSVGTIERLNCSRRRFLSEKDRGVASASSNCASLRVSQPPLVLFIYRFNQRPSTNSNSSSSTQIVDSLEFSFSFCPFCPRHHDIMGSSTRTRGFFSFLQT
jgi:hypothetical protein